MLPAPSQACVSHRLLHPLSSSHGPRGCPILLSRFHAYAFSGAWAAAACSGPPADIFPARSGHARGSPPALKAAPAPSAVDAHAQPGPTAAYEGNAGKLVAALQAWRARDGSGARYSCQEQMLLSASIPSMPDVSVCMAAGAKLTHFNRLLCWRLAQLPMRPTESSRCEPMTHARLHRDLRAFMAAPCMLLQKSGRRHLGGRGGRRRHRRAGAGLPGGEAGRLDGAGLRDRLPGGRRGRGGVHARPPPLACYLLETRFGIRHSRRISHCCLSLIVHIGFDFLRSAETHCPINTHHLLTADAGGAARPAPRRGAAGLRADAGPDRAAPGGTRCAPAGRRRQGQLMPKHDPTLPCSTLHCFRNLARRSPFHRAPLLLIRHSKYASSQHVQRACREGEAGYV